MTILSFLRRILRRESPQLEQLKKRSVREKQVTKQHVDELKAQLRELNGKKQHHG